uniref:NADH dehydrogenase [ubiquinone] 1 beta subcomplex subunit 6 n=1 Tax=Dromaius novaehollandiae TaxID=8790 RepID=A0A8C4J0J1_DRONO
KAGPSSKLRLQQLRALRRRWLRDQELSEREPVLPRRQLGPVAAFWERFLQPGGQWRLQVFRAYQSGAFAVTRVLLPATIVLYYVKYHVMVGAGSAAGPAGLAPRAAGGDRILETGEVFPPLKEEPGDHH